MVYSALAENDEELANAPYRVLEDWQVEHDGNLLIILPDTYGTKGFFERAPKWLKDWTGVRIDSGDPVEAANLVINWWRENGQNPLEKRLIFSDGLSVDRIASLHAQFAHQTKISFGWGTLLTNDFRGLANDDALAPFSMVCKAIAANGKPTVKLSDNPRKAMGPASEIERYKRVFNVGEQTEEDVLIAQRDGERYQQHYLLDLRQIVTLKLTVQKYLLSWMRSHQMLLAIAS